MENRIVADFWPDLYRPNFAGAAKDLNLYDHDSKPYYFGITLAGSMSRFHMDQHPRFLADDSVYVGEPNNSGGFGLGLLATMRISDRFSVPVQSSISFYSQKHSL
ncbi:MAG: hypothetical protein WDO16_06320 [Bacteroidota bacterium]